MFVIAKGHVYLSLVIIFIGREKNYGHPSKYLNDACYNFIKTTSAVSNDTFALEGGSIFPFLHLLLSLLLLLFGYILFVWQKIV